MKIKEFKVSGCKRFSLAGIDSISLTPDNPLQVIIGTNGCGKSTLLSFLSMPTPADPSAFMKGSQLDYNLTHQGSAYKIASKFTPSARYYFEKDGEVLNDWGTGLVQKDLLKEHFGIDQKFKQLFTSMLTFHKMNPTQRREWFIQVCDTDYTYALSIYGKLKDKLRDIQGALKLAKKRHSIEIEKLFKSDEVKQAQEDASMLQQLLTCLIEYRKPLEKGESAWEMLIEDLWSKIDTLYARIDTLKQPIALYNDSHKALVSTRYENACKQDSALSAVLQIKSKEIDLLDKQISLLKNAEEKNSDDLSKVIEQLQLQLKNLSTLVDLNQVDPYQASEVYCSIRDELLFLWEGLPNNSKGQYTRTQLDQSQGKLNNLDKLLNEARVSRDTIANNLSHMQSHRDDADIECPKCTHKFSAVYNPKLYADQYQKLKALEVYIPQLELQISELREYVQIALKVEQSYTSFSSIRKATPILNAYWTWFNENKVLHNPENIAFYLNEISKDLEVQKKKWSILVTIDDKSKQLQTLKATGANDISSLTQRHDNAHLEYEKLLSKLMNSRSMGSHYKKVLDALNKIQDLKMMIQKLTNDLKLAQDSHIEDMRRRHYNELVTKVQSLLGAKEHMLVQANNQITVVNSLQDQITELEKREKACSDSVKVLSPTDGLIAKAMIGFIQSFVTQMNRIIARVFTYKVEVLPCSIDSESDVTELDYKFPVMVQAERVSDVSELSRGQAEMVDLAFLITAMTVMKKNDFPLILDEIGNALDSVHKTNLILLLKDLLDNGVFQQIFLVSHDYTQYTSIKADFLVMDPSNVIVPEIYNSHAKVTLS